MQSLPRELTAAVLSWFDPRDTKAFTLVSSEFRAAAAERVASVEYGHMLMRDAWYHLVKLMVEVHRVCDPMPNLDQFRYTDAVIVYLSTDWRTPNRAKTLNNRRRLGWKTFRGDELVRSLCAIALQAVRWPWAPFGVEWCALVGGKFLAVADAAAEVQPCVEVLELFRKKSPNTSAWPAGQLYAAAVADRATNTAALREAAGSSVRTPNEAALFFAIRAVEHKAPNRCTAKEIIANYMYAAQQRPHTRVKRAKASFTAVTRFIGTSNNLRSLRVLLGLHDCDLCAKPSDILSADVRRAIRTNCGLPHRPAAAGSASSQSGRR